MCRGKLAGVIPCSCSSVKLTAMDRKKIHKVTSLRDIPTAAHSELGTENFSKLAGNSHPKSLYSIRRRISSARTRPYRSQTSLKSKHLSLLPSVNNDTDIEQDEHVTTPVETLNHAHFYLDQEHRCSLQSTALSSHSDNDAQPIRPRANSETTATEHRKFSKRRRQLHTIIPSPIPDERLPQDVEFRVSENAKEEALVTERMDNYYKRFPLELIGLDSEDSVVDLESIILEEDDSDDVGPEAVVVDDTSISNPSTKKVTFREHRGRSRSHSMSEVHRRVHVLDELLFSIDLEYGASDTGPEPELLFDNLPDEDSLVTSAGHTKDHATERRHRNSDSEAIIESLFAPKQKHSCCKNKRKSSWNAGTRRKSSSQVNFVPRHRPRKIVVVGDMCSGKSALISAYCKDRFNETYVPTILRSCLTDATLNGDKIELVVIEVSGREDYHKLRKCAYRKTDAVVLCYSCDNSSSLQKIKTQWLPEIRESIPNVPLVLVGTRKDIRDEILDELRAMTPEERGKRDIKALKSRLITESEGYEMSESIGAQYFLECSARYRDGTRHVFETVAKVALQKSRRKKKAQRTGDVCSVM